MRGIDGLAIDARDGGDVFRRLEAAFDFEAGDAQLDEARDFLHRGEVLRAEQITPVAEVAQFAVDDQFDRACGRPGRTRRGWRCAGRGFRWSGTGRNRRRTARRARKPPAAPAGSSKSFQFAQRQLARQHRAVEPELRRKRQALPAR